MLLLFTSSIWFKYESENLPDNKNKMRQEYRLGSNEKRLMKNDS